MSHLQVGLSVDVVCRWQ